jgi:hypothetical protein
MGIKKQMLFFISLFLLALAVRLLPIYLFGGWGITLDMHQYDSLARSLAENRGYRWYTHEEAAQFAKDLAYFGVHVSLPSDPNGIPTSFRAPLYPFFLSLIYRLVALRSRFISARIVQAVLGAGVAIITSLLACVINSTRRQSQIAGGIVAFYTILIFYPLGLVTENLFIPLLLLNLIALVAAGKSNRLPFSALAGFVAGLTALTRSLVVATWPLQVWWLWKYHGGRRKGLFHSTVLILFMLLTTLPWSIRNSLLYKQPVWIETSLGYVLYLGYHPTSTGIVQPSVTMQLISIQDDLVRNRVGMQAAFSFIRSNPRRAITQVIQRLGIMWTFDWREFLFFYQNNYLGQWPPWLLILMLLWLGLPLVFLVIFAIYGLLTHPMTLERILLLGVIICLLLVHVLTLADTRYRLPFIPLLAIFAAQGLTTRPNRLVARRTILASIPFLLIWGNELLTNWGRLTVLLSPGGNATYLGY